MSSLCTHFKQFTVMEILAQNKGLHVLATLFFSLREYAPIPLKEVMPPASQSKAMQLKKFPL